MFRRATLSALLALLAAAPAAGRDDRWIEVRSPRFIVFTNAGERQGRRVAEQFEMIRGVFKHLYPKARVDPATPLIIFAARDERTMKQLLPDYWESRERMRPAGIFVRGEDRPYVAVRVDLPGEFPYQIVYHEYAHLLLDLAFKWVPLWLNEGMAEFFSGTMLSGKEAIVGRASAPQVELLRTQRLFSLEDLFQVDYHSPHYSERNKASIFYAQSWAVVHYLMLADRAAHTDKLNRYLTLLYNEVEEPRARREALGDLATLERNLADYVRKFTFPAVRLPGPGDVNEKEFSVREMSAVEVAAAQGDFLLHHGRYAEARQSLERALAEDPNRAAVHESLGFLHFRQGDKAQAARYFEKAVELDSRSYLANYYHAMLLAEGASDESAIGRVERALRRAIELNAEFAPAYSTLASFVMRRRKELAEAEKLVRKAIELEPGVLGHHINYGYVLLNMEKVEQARVVARRAMIRAKSEQEEWQARVLQGEIEKYAQYREEARRREEEDRLAQQRWEQARAEQRRKLEQVEERLEREAAAPASPAKVEAPMRSRVEGMITEVQCAARGRMTLGVKLPTYTVDLHATNYHKVEFLSETDLPKPFNPCSGLRGRRARVTFEVGERAGEIVTIELLK
jgi:tetratricopeptide (TPR) repeat protein